MNAATEVSELAVVRAQEAEFCDLISEDQLSSKLLKHKIGGQMAEVHAVDQIHEFMHLFALVFEEVGEGLEVWGVGVELQI
jgi:hypothetical protein